MVPTLTQPKFIQVKACFFFASLRLCILTLGLLAGCQPVCQKMEPEIQCPLPEQKISALPGAFPSLSADELKQDWAKELIIADGFAKECDFYRAITSYKRALFLLPKGMLARQLQLEYDVILCYYLGGKYQEAINLFETSEVNQAHSNFPAFNNLLLMIYDAYLQTKQEDKSECVLEIIKKYSPETAGDLTLYQTMKEGNIEETKCLISQHRNAFEMEKEFAFYEQFAKSPKKAKILNAVLPGAGYYYVGQKKSAMTSFVINALFTLAAYQFFAHGYPAAGAITTSIEAGWYLGGINGAGIEAQEFNTRLFEGMSRKILSDHTCFPVLMFETSF